MHIIGLQTVCNFEITPTCFGAEAPSSGILQYKRIEGQIHYNLNLFKYLILGIVCTSQIDALVLVLSCVSDFLRMAPRRRNV